jgi:Protein of unknown function (DUF2281)
MLPPEKQQTGGDFIAFLRSQDSNQARKKEREFGCVKGAMYMAPDFDAPLEDFKDYM